MRPELDAPDMFCQQCPICASDVDLGSKDWRALYQELSPADGSSAPAQSLRPPTGAQPNPETFEPRIHYACWRIACSHNRIRNLSVPGFLLFKRCMLDLAPLQPRLCSVEAPDESKLHNFPKDKPPNRPAEWGTLDRLPYELRYQILEMLADFQDVDNLAQATGAGFPRFLGRNLCWRSFGVKLDVVQLRHVSRALRHSPGLVNYTTIWENVKRILQHMDRPFYGVSPVPVLPNLDLTWPASSATRTANLLQMAGRVSRVDFHFCRFGPASYLTGVGVDGSLVGYRGDQIHTEELRSARNGLRIIFNKIGINAIQVRSGDGWSAIAGGHGTDAMGRGERVFFSESWDLFESNILGFFDVFPLQMLVGIAARTARRKLPVPVRISRNGFFKRRMYPSPIVVPTIPHTWDVLYLRDDMIGFSVFVYDTEQIIIGLEVQYSDGTSSRLGLDDDSVVKLTLCLSLQGTHAFSSDDTIQSIRVGKSSTSDALAIELWTTNRVFTIGKIDESWGPTHFECPTSMIYAFSHDGSSTPRAVGFALPNEPSTTPIQHGSEKRPSQTISFSPGPGPQHGDGGFFFSRSKLSNIVNVVAYSRSTAAETISGIAFAYRAGPPSILGQAHSPCGSFQKQSSDNLREIIVYYEPYLFGHRVSGVRLFSWAAHSATFGNCSNSNFEILRVSHETDILVWRFKQVYSDLTLQPMKEIDMLW